VRAGADIAAMMGIAKAVLGLDHEARRTGAELISTMPSSWSTRTGSSRSKLGCARQDGRRSRRLADGLAPRLKRPHLPMPRARSVSAIRHGPDAASPLRRQRPDADQPAADARQHRQAAGAGIPSAAIQTDSWPYTTGPSAASAASRPSTTNPERNHRRLYPECNAHSAVAIRGGEQDARCQVSVPVRISAE
jgi:hypothetical protein